MYTTTRTYSDDPTVHHYAGPWQQLVKVSRCLCEDGAERTVYLREPDTYFTIPGRTQVKGKTVSGYVSQAHDSERLMFYAVGKNADVVTGETRPCFRSIK